LASPAKKLSDSLLAYSARARSELRRLVAVRPSDRPWWMPLTSALSTGLPIAIGAHFSRLEDGLVATLGGLVCLYLPETSMRHRMRTMLSVSFGMVLCFTLGLLASTAPALVIPVLGLLAMLASVLCSTLRIGPPGNVFFVMVASVAAYTAWDPSRIFIAAAWFAAGALLACAWAYCASAIHLRRRAPNATPTKSPESPTSLLLHGTVVGLSVTLCLWLAHALDLERPYWIPVSCLAVMQGATLRDVWHRKIHRLVGTAVGLLLAAVLLDLPSSTWGLIGVVALLMFLIETSIVRHYAVAVVFITPLTILLAEVSIQGQGAAHSIMESRMLDTVLGCFIGMLGSFALELVRQGGTRQT